MEHYPVIKHLPKVVNNIDMTLGNIKINYKWPCTKDGIIFGSVNNYFIYEQLCKRGIYIPPEHIQVDTEFIKNVGWHEFQVYLHGIGWKIYKFKLTKNLNFIKDSDIK